MHSYYMYEVDHNGQIPCTRYLLKILSYELCIPLHIIFKTSLDSTTCPTFWKYADITPIFKKGDPSQAHNYQARTQEGGVRWVRTNPPLRSQLQNDSAHFLNKLSINNRGFGYTVKMRLFCYVKHIIGEKIWNQSSNCSKKYHI